jgi:predicted O-methyltransferase YrrM
VIISQRGLEKRGATAPENLLARTLTKAIRHPSWFLYYTLGSRFIFPFRKVSNCFISALTGATERRLNRLWDDLASRRMLTKALNPLKAYVIMRKTDFYSFILFAEVFYVICRLLEPQLVVETGVMHGISTAFILQALSDNGKGILYSIDAPYDYIRGRYLVHHRLPENFQRGWIVPTSLRMRWKLVSGRSRQELPRLLSQVGQIDIFVHDSEHTYDLMLFEYGTAWRHLKDGGLLLSDDVDRSAAFSDFLTEKPTENHSILLNQLGGIRKSETKSTTDISVPVA